jgi:hypothetical protein
LAADNRWAIVAELIPLSEFEPEYAQNFVTEMEPLARIISPGVGGINY